MIDSGIEKIITDDRIKALEKKLSEFEKNNAWLKKQVSHINHRIRWACGIVSIVVAIAGFFGYNMWTSISTKINELNKNAEKVEARYVELNNQMLLAGQSNVKLNTQFTDLSTLISKKHEEQLRRFTELNKISSKALLDSERAMHNAGMLVDAVKAAQTSANRCEETNKHVNEQMKQIESYMKSIKDSFNAIQKTQVHLESYIAKNIKIAHHVDKFKVSVSSRFGTYIVIEGDGIPCDKQFAGTNVNSYIIIPKNCNATIDDSGSGNTFLVSDKVKTRIDIVGSGAFRTIRSGEYTFR